MSATATDTAPTAVELVLARERATGGEGGVEALVRVKVRVHCEGRRHLWRSSAVATLATALETWPRESFPQILDALARDFDGLRPRVALTADHFAWFARHAPVTFDRLQREADLEQRDACYALVCDADSARFVWRPAGPVAIEQRPAPLFDLAHALAHGRVLGAPAAGDEACALVRMALLAHWVHGRLPAELEWLPATRSLRRRVGERALFLREGDTFGSHTLVLIGDSLPEPVALNCTPPPGTPLAVVRAALTWLLTNASPNTGELFLDPEALHVRCSIG